MSRLDLLAEAADWYALLQADAVSAADRSRWQAWLDADSAHRDAWHAIERISARFQGLGEQIGGQTAAQALKAARQPLISRRQLLTLLAVSSTGLLSWHVGQQADLADALRARLAAYRTETGEIRHVQLPDGSDVWLNTASALDADYSAQQREISLYRGEILIETAHTDPRDFVVATAHGRLRALGTRYAVRRLPQDTLLSVFSGAVEVIAAGRTQVIHAGQQVLLNAAGPGAIRPAAPYRESWAHGILLADDMPLGELIAELARYYHAPLRCSAAVARLPVMGTYPVQDTEQALDMLRSVLPIRLLRQGAQIRIVANTE